MQEDDKKILGLLHQFFEVLSVFEEKELESEANKEVFNSLFVIYECLVQAVDSFESIMSDYNDYCSSKGIEPIVKPEELKEKISNSFPNLAFGVAIVNTNPEVFLNDIAEENITNNEIDSSNYNEELDIIEPTIIDPTEL